jgi:hypothetical protein
LLINILRIQRMEELHIKMLELWVHCSFSAQLPEDFHCLKVVKFMLKAQLHTYVQIINRKKLNKLTTDRLNSLSFPYQQLLDTVLLLL